MSRYLCFILNLIERGFPNMSTKQKVLLAAGHPGIHQELKKLDGIQVLGEIGHRQQLLPAVLQTKADAILISPFLPERTQDLVSIMEEIRHQSPQTRVIYLAGNLDSSQPEHRKMVQRLVNVQIYDIHMLNHLSLQILQEYLFHPSTIQDLEGWVELPKPASSLMNTSSLAPELKPSSFAETVAKNRESQEAMFNSSSPVSPTPSVSPTSPQRPMPQASAQTSSPNPSFTPSTSQGNYFKPEEAKAFDPGRMEDIGGASKENSYYLPKLFVVSSIKPGSGKSFVSSNLATAIAQFGQPGPDGRKPSVALIEGDLQNLSIGTILGIKEDHKYNLKTAIEKIDSIIDARTGDLRPGVEPHHLDEVDSFIRSCFKEFKMVKNLKTLVGSQFAPDELALVTKHHYRYLLEAIVDIFDVVIVDTNSSLHHVTTEPLLRLANQIFYVLNLDYNNVHNNYRYRTKLVSMGIGDKIKYILNEDVSQNKDNKEKLIFGPDQLVASGFNLTGAIPAIDKAVFLNRLHDSKPIVIDEEKITLKARLELCRIAENIWPMDNIVLLESEWKKYEASQLGGGFKASKPKNTGFKLFGKK